MDWMLHALLPLALAAVGLLLSLLLFLSLKRDLVSVRKLWAGERQSLLTAHEQLREEIHQLRQRVQEGMQPAEVTPAPQLVSGMNLSRRAQVLRMARRGERPEQIAAALGIPLREVELLLKIQEVTRIA